MARCAGPAGGLRSRYPLKASACGAAICALEAIGARDTLRGRNDAIIHTYVPAAEAADAYARGRARHLALERAIAPFNHPS